MLVCFHYIFSHF